jgi:hypothetical protein
MVMNFSRTEAPGFKDAPGFQINDNTWRRAALEGVLI